jgi:hypothetical protein
MSQVPGSGHASSEPPVPGSRVSDYDYELPPGRIARYPARDRDESRLLVVDRGGSPIRHLRFRDLLELVPSGDLLVVNESRVLPVRLLGRKPTGAPSEILLLGRWGRVRCQALAGWAPEPAGAGWRPAPAGVSLAPPPLRAAAPAPTTGSSGRPWCGPGGS